MQAVYSQAILDKLGNAPLERVVQTVGYHGFLLHGFLLPSIATFSILISGILGPQGNTVFLENLVLLPRTVLKHIKT